VSSTARRILRGAQRRSVESVDARGGCQPEDGFGLENFWVSETRRHPSRGNWLNRTLTIRTGRATPPTSPRNRIWAGVVMAGLGGRDTLVSLPLTTRRHGCASVVFCPVRCRSHGTGGVDSVVG
jgi:hypothetical protein